VHLLAHLVADKLALPEVSQDLLKPVLPDIGSAPATSQSVISRSTKLTLLSCSLFCPLSMTNVIEDLQSTYNSLFYHVGGIYKAIDEYKKLDAPTWL
jgi:hypothetical protein